jgi:phenylacetate-coenzyme A ligase PaaK-like adenylate-forming protein
LGTEYQVIIGEKDRDSLALAVEVKPGLPMDEWEHLKKNLSEKIHYETHLRFEILLKNHGEIARGNFKSKRFIDMR